MAELLLSVTTKETLFQSINDKEYTGMTAIHLAIVNCQTNLLQSIFNVCRNFSILDELESMEAGGEVLEECYGLTGMTPLQLAAAVGNKEVINCLIQNYCKLDKQNSKGNTIFHSLVFASKKHSNQAIKTLKYILSSSKATFCNSSAFSGVFIEFF